jgi:hypothetical protein
MSGQPRLPGLLDVPEPTSLTGSLAKLAYDVGISADRIAASSDPAAADQGTVATRKASARASPNARMYAHLPAAMPKTAWPGIADCDRYPLRPIP